MSNTQFIRFYSLWPATSGRGWRGSYERDVNPMEIAQRLAEGWGILLFEEDQQGNDRRPTHRLVLAPPRDQQPQQRTVDERRDAPSRHVGAQQSQRAVRMQGPAVDLDDSIPF